MAWLEKPPKAVFVNNIELSKDKYSWEKNKLVVNVEGDDTEKRFVVRIGI